MVNETLLIQKYDKDVRRIVNSYLYSTHFSSKCSFYEDLISEAFLAFLSMCRAFDLQDAELSDLQRAMCKKKIESALRVYIWKMFNMGGYNNRKIDLSRSVTISDILGDTDLGIDDVAPNTYQDDFSTCEMWDFVNSLTTKNKKLLFAIMQGYELRQIGKFWKQSHNSLSQRLAVIRKKYTNYLKTATAA